VVELDGDGQRNWREMAEKAWAAIRGGIVDEKDFDQVIQIRDAYRASKKK
jgi:hypothetical protein